MTLIKPSHFLAFFAWGSFFALSWLILGGRVESDSFVTWFFLVFYFIVAFIASVLAGAKPIPPKAN